MSMVPFTIAKSLNDFNANEINLNKKFYRYLLYGKKCFVKLHFYGMSEMADLICKALRLYEYNV